MPTAGESFFGPGEDVVCFYIFPLGTDALDGRRHSGFGIRAMDTLRSQGEAIPRRKDCVPFEVRHSA